MQVVRVIAVPGCGQCVEVKMRLREAARRHPDLAIQELDLLSDEGAALAGRHRVWTHPTVIVGDSVVAEGDVEVPDLEAVLGLLGTEAGDATAGGRTEP